MLLSSLQHAYRPSTLDWEKISLVQADPGLELVKTL